MICTYISLLLSRGADVAFAANHLWRNRRVYSADALFHPGLELALDKTIVKETHVYIMEAVLPPKKARADPAAMKDFLQGLLM